MQEPCWRAGALCEVAIESGAEQPETQAALVLDAEIIARRPAVLAPPGTLDALGAFGRDHLMQGPPPSETQRRAVGDFGYSFDQLRPRQQPERTRRQFCFLAVLSKPGPAGIAVDGLRGKNGFGQFRNMTVLSDQPVDAARPQPGAQTIDKTTELGCILTAAYADLFGRTGLGDNNRQSCHVKPKPGSNASARAASRSTNSSRISSGSRKGREVPVAMRRTTPSVRNRASSIRRAPSPRRSSANCNRRASRLVIARTSSSRAIGSAKR